MRSWINYFTGPAESSSNAHQKTKDNLLLAQYALLGLTLYELYRGNVFTAGFVMATSFYIEKFAAKAYELFFHDIEKAKYISDHYSHLSRTSEVLVPGAKQVASEMQEDLAEIKQSFVRR